MSIQGQLLEITVVGCTKLKDTEWISRQDPYVRIEYGSTENRTRTCTDGGKNPVFQEKFVFTLIEGLRELTINVWNSNTWTFDTFIGTGKIPLQKVLSQGFDDSAWPLQTKTGRYAGEVRLILHYANAIKQASNFAPSAPPYAAQPPHQVSLYSTLPPVSAATYPQPPTAYAAPSSYPPNAAAYPPFPYPPNQPSAYPPSTYPPPAHSVYPPPYPLPPQTSPYYPPGPYPGLYPPSPY